MAWAYSLTAILLLIAQIGLPENELWFGIPWMSGKFIGKADAAVGK